MSRIGRRFKSGKIKSIEDIKRTYIDSVLSQAKGKLSAIPSNIKHHDFDSMGYDYDRIGEPEGSKLRDFLYKQKMIPSSYAAANVDELWAVSVEYVAMDYIKDKELKNSFKKLIYATLTGSML